MTTLRITVLAALFVLAGCSSGGGDGIASAGGTQTGTAQAEQASDEEKAREFVDCMRAEGIDLPDPMPDGQGGFDFGLDEAGAVFDDPAFQQAIQACRDKLPGGGRENLDDPEVQAQLREFAQCMRDNGIDFPDPEPGGGFGGALAEIDRTGPAFQQALEACTDMLPDRGGR
jgi:hypothetical protein